MLTLSLSRFVRDKGKIKTHTSVSVVSPLVPRVYSRFVSRVHSFYCVDCGVVFHPNFVFTPFSCLCLLACSNYTTFFSAVPLFRIRRLFTIILPHVYYTFVLNLSLSPSCLIHLCIESTCLLYMAVTFSSYYMQFCFMLIMSRFYYTSVPCLHGFKHSFLRLTLAFPEQNMNCDKI